MLGFDVEILRRSWSDRLGMTRGRHARERRPVTRQSGDWRSQARSSLRSRNRGDDRSYSGEVRGSWLGRKERFVSVAPQNTARNIRRNGVLGLDVEISRRSVRDAKGAFREGVRNAKSVLRGFWSDRLPSAALPSRIRTSRAGRMTTYAFEDAGGVPASSCNAGFQPAESRQDGGATTKLEQFRDTGKTWLGGRSAVESI